MNRSSHKKILFLIFAAAGLLMGTAVPGLFRMGTGNYAGFFSLYSMQKYQQKVQDGTAETIGLLPYILSVRLKTLIFLWMSSFTTAGLLFHAVYFWWLAVSAGMLLSLLLLREGIRGALLFGCCLLPQWMLYSMMWHREAGVFLHRWRLGADISQVNTASVRKKELQELVRMVLLCLLGCGAEVFLGRWTLRLFMNFK